MHWLFLCAEQNAESERYDPVSGEPLNEAARRHRLERIKAIEEEMKDKMKVSGRLGDG
jgi:hypothetical protein